MTKKSWTQIAWIGCLCALSVLESDGPAAAKDGPREAVEGLLERAGPSNFIAPALLPDVPAPPAVKPVWEGRLENWLKALGDDDYSVRDKATQEMLQEQDPKFEEKLQVILSAQSDPEVAARLRMVIEGLVQSRRVRELKSKLSSGLLAKAPAIAEQALSSDEAELLAALREMVPPKDAGGFVYPEKMAAGKEDVKIIVPAILAGLERVESDPSRLGKDVKRLLADALEWNCVVLRSEMKDHAAYIAHWLVDPDPFYRWRSIQYLAIWKPDADTADKAAALLHDPSGLVRSGAVDGLAFMRAMDKEPEIIGLLGDPDSLVRLSCIQFLGGESVPMEPKAVPGLAAMLGDTELDVIFHAARLLEKWGKLEGVLPSLKQEPAIRLVGLLDKWSSMGIKGFLKALEALAKHPDPTVAQAASAALKSIQEKPAR